MNLVCGIDVGSLRTPSYVAWLDEGEFTLDVYLASAERPLPVPPQGRSDTAVFALDAPQGLPAPGSHRRECDRAANTPTRVLPADREALRGWRLYRGPVEAGVEMFWSVHERRLGSVFGMGTEPPLVCETYPRYVLRRLWPGASVPSKRKSPLAYVEAVWSLLANSGYSCDAPPALYRTDHVDAMLCALAAEACADTGGAPAGTVGCDPAADIAGQVLREGWIVAP